VEAPRPALTATERMRFDMATNNLQPGDVLANPSRRNVLGILAVGTVAAAPAAGAIDLLGRYEGAFPLGANPGAPLEGLDTMNMHVAITRSMDDASATVADLLASYRSAANAHQSARGTLWLAQRAKSKAPRIGSTSTFEIGDTVESFNARVRAQRLEDNAARADQDRDLGLPQAIAEAARTKVVRAEAYQSLLDLPAVSLHDFVDQFKAAMDEGAGSIDARSADLLLENIVQLMDRRKR